MMENGDFEGDSADDGQSTASTDLKEELTSLTGSLQRTSEHLELQEKDSEYKMTFLFGLFGGAVGAACGGITGGVGGAVGAAGAAAYSVFCKDFTAYGATVGFVGSIIGGALGGVFGGTFGGAVGAATARGTASPAYISLVSDVSLVAFGCATGGAIGCNFHKTVGTIGGAAGAAFGALVARGLAAGLAGMLCDHLSGNRDSVELITKLLLRVLKEQQRIQKGRNEV